MEKTFSNGAINECCKVAENVEPDPGASNKPELTVRKCKVCGRRHYRLKAEPAIFGMTFRPGN